jgi:opacity protein-like surface antigen
MTGLSMTYRKHVFSLLIGILISSVSLADPWAPPGDLILRHDVQLLADAGIIRSPVTTWPITWATLNSDVSSAPNAVVEQLDGQQRAALARVRKRIATNRGLTGFQPSAEVSVRSDDFWLRTFEDTPREESELRVGGSWMGGRFAVRVQGSYVDQPDPDDQEWRMDGSYAAMVIGNHIISAGAIDRWWGPSWDNTLLYSSAARPVGALALERNVAKEFETKWLNWIGPWTYSLTWGFLGDDRVVENTRHLAFRVAFRPIQSLEIGLSRAALWCGSGRPCDADALWDIVRAEDNTDEGGVTPDNDPSNQLAAVDARWSSPIGDGPWALYTQWVANDETNNLPSQWFGQGGIEWWGELATRWIAGSYTAHIEATSTIAEFWESAPAYDGAYNHGTYRTGYRYTGRSLGAAVDGDSISVSAGMSLVQEDDRSWNALVRWDNLNRKGDAMGADAVHSVATEEQKTWGLQLSHRRGLSFGEWDLGYVSLGVGYQHSENEVSGGNEDDFHGFLQWTWDPQGVW